MNTHEMLFDRFERAWLSDPIRFETLPGVSKSWPANKLVRLYKLVNEASPLTQDQIASVLKVDRSTVSRKASSMDWSEFENSLGKLCFQSTDESLDEDADEQRKNMLVKQAIKRRKSDVDQLAMLKHIEDRILNEVSSLPKPSVPLFLSRGKKKNTTPETAVLLLSDLHVGQEFTMADTSNLSEYNIELFRKRAENLKKAVVEIMSLHTKLYDVPELRVFGLGDFVQGGNLNGQWGPAYNSNTDVADQTIIAADTISDILSAWSPLFKKIRFAGVVGNHGRAGAGKNTDKVSANWDRMAYALMKARLRQHQNIEVSYSDSWWLHENVHGKRFLLVHGDHIQGSIASLHREEQRFQSLISKTNGPFEYLCIGHFHSHQEIETTSGGILVNGSFVGGDVHSMHQLRCKSAPTQTFFGVHPDRGMTWKYLLNLDFKRD